jgi:hypothetical protein
MTEDLRRRLTREAERNGCSLRDEMLKRLEESFANRAIVDVTERLEKVFLNAENLVAGRPILGKPIVHPGTAQKEEKK